MNDKRIDNIVESTWAKLMARLIAPSLIIAAITGVGTGVSRIYASISEAQQAIALLAAEVKYNRERADQAIEREAKDLAAVESQLANHEVRIQGLEHHVWPPAPIPR